MTTSTLNSRLSSARLCAANSWAVNDVLHAPANGAEESLDKVIRITAIGEAAILARTWEWGMGNWSEEMAYTLTTRAWRGEIEPERAARCAGRAR